MAVPAVAPSVLAESSIQRKAEEEAAWKMKQEEDVALAAEDGASFFEEDGAEPEEEPTPKKPKLLSPAELAVAYREAVQAVIEDHDILPDTAYASSRIAKWAWTEQGVQISSADVGTVLRSLGWQLRAGPGATAYYSPGKARQ
jgi:transposase